METYTSCRYLKADSSFGTTLNWFPSKYLNKETQTVQFRVIRPFIPTKMRYVSDNSCDSP